MIKVNENMLNFYDDEYRKAAEAFGKLKDYHTELDKLLASGNWKGNHHDTCADIVAAANSYLISLKADFDTLKSDVVDLVDDTDSFVNNSQSVQKIQE